MTVTSAAADADADAYRAAGARWAADAALVYGPLAHHLVDRCADLDGRTVLDIGAGTGLAGDAATRRGATVVAADHQADMLRAGPAGRPAVVTDIDRLPFRSAAFDVCIAAFVLNHVTEPARSLRELARVTAAGGRILASTFGAVRAPAKARIDEVVVRHGWTPPGWYERLQQRAAALSTVSQVVRAARSAGLTIDDACEAEVDVGLRTPEQVVRYRLGMPHIRPFVDALDPADRASLVDDAMAAVDVNGAELRVNVVELVALIPAGDRAPRSASRPAGQLRRRATGPT